MENEEPELKTRATRFHGFLAGLRTEHDDDTILAVLEDAFWFSDEIIRLRGINASQSRMIFHYEQLRETLNRIIEHMREALERIAKKDCAGCGASGDAPVGYAFDCEHDIARAALADAESMLSVGEPK